MQKRPRRNRMSPAIRALVRETSVQVTDLVLPMFFHEGGEDVPIESMPGVTRWSLAGLVREVGEAAALGIPAVVLFPKIEDALKSADAAACADDGGLVARAVRAVKSAYPGLCVITDVALDPYSSDGHDGLVSPDGDLVVPMRALDDGRLVGAQVIHWDGESWSKKYLYGTRAKGAVLRLGPQRATESVLVEGYATGLSVHAAARSIGMMAAIYVTFSADNLAHVAPLLRGHRYVIADHDKSGTGQRVAESTGLPWAMSDQLGEDANDLACRAGLMAVARLLMACRSDRRRTA